ncbi:MAG: Kelch repeat-containing protein [bacterium]
MRPHFIKIIILVILLVFLISGCRKKNQPPYTPYTPNGPTSGVTNNTYQFFSLAIDPDGDSVSIRFDFGNGDTSDWSELVAMERTVRISFSWSVPDTYYVKAQAKDKDENISEWSLPHTVIITLNRPPNTPPIPFGPSTGYAGFFYPFSSLTIDPDTDRVAIRFDFGDGSTSDWSGWVSSGDTVKIWYSWLYPDNFCVKAQAKDEFGAVSDWSAPAFIAIDIKGLVWICATDSAGWAPRESHASVVFDNKIWVTGGHHRNDEVWSSPDGVNWTCVTYSAGFGIRDDFTMVVFDGKIWVIGGGECHRNPKNDVWCSSDGVNWRCVTDSAQWSPRYHHSSVVFDDKIWVLGGTTGEERLNDVWYSADGANWTCATNSARWSARDDHTSVTFNNKIWLMGGYDGNLRNDVWYSTDGRDWSRATASAAWSGRCASTSVVFDNKIWILGGGDGSYLGYNNEVWYSTNGYSWILDCPLIRFSPRWDHTAVVFDNKIWVLGGGPFAWVGSNDVWYRAIIE